MKKYQEQGEEGLGKKPGNPLSRYERRKELTYEEQLQYQIELLKRELVEKEAEVMRLKQRTARKEGDAATEHSWLYSPPERPSAARSAPLKGASKSLPPRGIAQMRVPSRDLPKAKHQSDVGWWHRACEMTVGALLPHAMQSMRRTRSAKSLPRFRGRRMRSKFPAHPPCQIQPPML